VVVAEAEGDVADSAAVAVVHLLPTKVRNGGRERKKNRKLHLQIERERSGMVRDAPQTFSAFSVYQKISPFCFHPIQYKKKSSESLSAFAILVHFANESFAATFFSDFPFSEKS
jgi:hypothetical protein